MRFRERSGADMAKLGVDGKEFRFSFAAAVR
jgi:hypothetical protein